MARVLWLALALAAAPSVAAPDAKQAQIDSEAKRYFQWAQRLYKQAQYTEAIAKFEEAYRIKPHPVVFFNIGRCAEQLGDIPRALRNYRDYLRVVPEAIDREQVTDAIANLERRLKEKGLQQLTIFADPPESKIEVDGNVLGTSPVSVELAPGNHKVIVRHPGYDPAERAFVMASQRSMELSFVLKKEPPPKPKEVVIVAVAEPVPPPVPKVEPVAAPVPQVRAAPPPTSRRLWTYVAAGVAGAGLAAGAGLGLSAQSASNELLGSVHEKAEANRLANQATSAAGNANLAYGAAAVTGAIALVLYFVEPALGGTPAQPALSASSPAGTLSF